MCRQPQECIVVHVRTPSRQPIADRGEPLGAAELLSLALHHTIEAVAEVLDLGWREAAGHYAKADEANAFGELRHDGTGRRLLDDAVPRCLSRATSHPHLRQADRTM